MSTYVVGDIQGCLDPLLCLLEEVEFNPQKDVLWSAGDIVNRGPKCLETLRFLYTMRKSLVMVLGNHDLHLLALAAGIRAPSRSDTLDKILRAPDRNKLLNWLVKHPLIHHEHDHTLVHAGIPPQWSLDDALRYGDEVHQVLNSPQRIDFFTHMYGNEPPVWSEKLRGMERLRAITNYLTRMRFCDEDGVLDFDSKGPTPNKDRPPQGPQKVAPWFSYEKRKTAEDRIIFGHWASIEGRTNSLNAIGLDTGCVWGRSMSLYNLETGQLRSCDCK